MRVVMPACTLGSCAVITLLACSNHSTPESCAALPTLRLGATPTAIASVVATTTSTTTTTSGQALDASVLTPDASGYLYYNDASTLQNSTQTTNTVFVGMELVANFQCSVQGAVHATLSTSVGQFSGGVPASAGGGSGGSGGGSGGSGGGGDAGTGASASAGSSGAAGTSVTVLLGAVPPIATPEGGKEEPEDSGLSDAALADDAGFQVVSEPGTALNTVLVGYVTLQITSSRETQVQAVVGDSTLCVTLVIGAISGAGLAPVVAKSCGL